MPSRPNRRAGVVGVALLLVALAVLLVWQTGNGLSHIDRMMAERSETLQRMISTEVRNVARYGKARRVRLDEVLADVASGSDVIGVSLERTDGALRLAHGELPGVLPPEILDGEGYLIRNATILRGGPVRIDTHSCGSCRGCEPSCPAFDEQHIDGDYLVVLALDAHPYRLGSRHHWRSPAVRPGAGALALRAPARPVLVHGAGPGRG
jgi:NAD-dependent dihydropyrimidine dehydrogenase PreA subunit